MSQKERLTSLGRLSTVIAHEVRNPLMIIKASLHALRQPDVERRGGARGGRRHRRRGRAAQPDRQRGARLRAADPLRAGAGRRQRAVPRVGGGGAGVGPGRGDRPRPRPGAAAGHAPTPSGCASRWSTCSSTRGTRSNGRPDDAPATLVDAQHARAAIALRRIVVADRGVGIAAGRPGARSSIRTSRPSAAAPASACRSPRTSSKGSAARSTVSSAPGRGTEIRIELPLDSARRRLDGRRTDP